MEKNIKTTYGEKELNIDTRDSTWAYDGINMTQIKELNNDLFTKISKFVANYIANYEEIEARKKEEAELERKKIRTVEVELFRQSVEDIVGPNPEYELKYDNVDNGSHNCNTKYVSINGGTATVYEDTNVYSSGSYYSHKTSKPWCLDCDYKTIRYGSLKNALTKAFLKVTERIEEAKLKKRAAADKTDKEAKMKEFAEANGFKYATRWHSSGRRNGRGYDTYHMIKGDTYGDKIDVKLGFIEKENKVTIISYSVIKKDITIDEVSSLVLEKIN